MYRRKKHEFVKAEFKEIEMHGSRKDARKFFQKIKRMSEGFKSKGLAGQTLWLILPQLQHHTGQKWPWPFSGLNSTKPAVMMASLLNFSKQQEMSWFAACTTFSATYGHWKACQVVEVLVCSAQHSKRPQSASIIVA